MSGRRAGQGAGDRHRQLRQRDPRAGQAGRWLRYTGKLGYHPLLATRADTSEVLHVRLREGQAKTRRPALRFVDELLAHVRRAGAAGQILPPADSGFQNQQVTAPTRAGLPLLDRRHDENDGLFWPIATA